VPREEISVALEQQVREQVRARLLAAGWTSLKPQPIGPPYLEALATPLTDGYSATFFVLPWLEVDDETGPISASAYGRLGLDYLPARELTAALVGFAAAGVVLKEPSVRAGLTDESDVIDARDRFVDFAIDQAPRLAELANVDALIEMLENGRAAASTEPLAFEDEDDEPPSGFSWLLDTRTELIPALLASDGRLGEARDALGNGNLATPAGEGSPNHRRFVRQLMRWIDAGGSLPLPTTPAQLPPLEWPPKPVHVSWRQAFAQNYPKTQARREAEAAVRAVSRDKTRDELRALLQQELRERDAWMEPRQVEMTIDMLATEHDALGKARLALRGVKALSELVTVGHKIFEEASDPTEEELEESEPEWLKPPERAAYPITTLHRHCVAVELDSGARTWLERVAQARSQLFGETEVEIWLTWEATPREVGALGLDVHIGETRVGRLDSDIAEHFRPAMDAAAERDEDPWTRGWLSKISGEMPYLLEVAVPETDPSDRSGQ
jgi:hypothetical protein